MKKNECSLRRSGPKFDAAAPAVIPVSCRSAASHCSLLNLYTAGTLLRQQLRSFTRREYLELRLFFLFPAGTPLSMRFIVSIMLGVGPALGQTECVDRVKFEE